MIDYLQVQRVAIKNNVSPEIIEKDYFIELVLFYFSKNSSLCDNFVFMRNLFQNRIIRGKLNLLPICNI